MSIQKSEIKLDVKGKKVNAYLADGGGKGILVLPSWWGLNLFFKGVCDQLAEHGYTALAPDYYHGRIGTTIDEAKALQQEAEGDVDAMNAMVRRRRIILCRFNLLRRLVSWVFRWVQIGQ